MSVAAGMVVYGVAIVYLVFASVLPATPAGEPASVMTTVSEYVLLGIALASFGGGIVVGTRRWVSRRIRLAIGHEDELTITWWKRVGSDIREKWAARGNRDDTATST